MNKYEEWKHMLSQWYSGNAYEEICKIIDKAEKYENLGSAYANICMKCKMRDKTKCTNYGCTIAFDILVQCLRDQNAFNIFELREENQKLKASRTADKNERLALLDVVNKLEQENKILKEGVKALYNYCLFNEERCNVYEDLSYIEVKFDSLVSNEKENGDFQKIKSMLEVVENDVKGNN